MSDKTYPTQATSSLPRYLDDTVTSSPDCVIDYPVIVTIGFADRIQKCKLGPNFQMIVFYSESQLEYNARALEKSAPQTTVLAPKAAALQATAPKATVVAPKATALQATAPKTTVIAPKATVVAPIKTPTPTSVLDTSAYAVLAALVAVLAVFLAAWKLYQRGPKAKPETKPNSGGQTSHKECAARNAALATQVDQIKTRLSAIESRQTQPTQPTQATQQPLDFGFTAEDFETLEKRVRTLERRDKNKQRHTERKTRR